jgi:transposase
MIIIGLDPHPDSHTACALDTNGAVLSDLRVDNTPQGFDELRQWASSFGNRRWAIEGAGNSFIAAWVAELLAAGEQLVNIHPNLTSQYRSRRSKKKNDAIDAANAARALLANPTLPPYQADARQSTLQELSRSRDRLAKELKANRMALKQLPLDSLVREPLQQVVEALEASIAALEREMSKQVDELAPELLDVKGIGVVSASIILAEAGDPQRFANQDHFASYCGAAPVMRGSGQSMRAQVNPEGNRRLNRILYLMVQTRLRTDGGRSQEYMARKLKQGKTRREALRALKTYVARELYQFLKDCWRPISGLCPQRA